MKYPKKESYPNVRVLWQFHFPYSKNWENGFEYDEQVYI